MLSCKTRLPPPPKKAGTSDASQHNGQWLVLNHCSCGVVSYSDRPPEQHKRELVPTPLAALKDSWTPGSFVSSQKTTQKRPPVLRLLCQPSPSATPVDQRLPSPAWYTRQNPALSDTSAVGVRHPRHTATLANKPAVRAFAVTFRT